MSGLWRAPVITGSASWGGKWQAEFWEFAQELKFMKAVWKVQYSEVQTSYLETPRVLYRAWADTWMLSSFECFIIIRQWCRPGSKKELWDLRAQLRKLPVVSWVSQRGCGVPCPSTRDVDDECKSLSLKDPQTTSNWGNHLECLKGVVWRVFRNEGRDVYVWAGEEIVNMCFKMSV